MKDGSAASDARGSSCKVSHENEDDIGGSMTMTSNLDGWTEASSENGRYVGGSAYSVTDAFLSAKRRCCLGYLVSINGISICTTLVVSVAIPVWVKVIDTRIQAV